jgi:hypothetical protein
MAKEPKIKVEDLPKDGQEVADEELDGVVGGVRHNSAVATTAKLAALRLFSADPCEGGE